MNCDLAEESDMIEEEENDAVISGGCSSNNIIRVLVLFSANANVVGNPNIVAQNIVTELNVSSSNSGLLTDDISFFLADTRQLTTFIETPDIGTDLDALVDNQEAIGHRNQTKADLVLLLADNSYIVQGVAGRAKGISVSNKNAYAIATIGAAARGLTGTHEIGHLMGGRHQRCANCSQNGCDFSPSFNHGFILGVVNRTIMAQNGCPGIRIEHWSNPDINFNGLSTGSTSSNNANKIRKRAKKISCFQPNPTPDVNRFVISFTGPNILSYTNPYQWTSIIPNDAALPIIYNWEISPNGVNDWTNIGSESVLTIINPNMFPCWFVLRLSVTDNDGNMDTFSMAISRDPC